MLRFLFALLAAAAAVATAAVAACVFRVCRQRRASLHDEQPPRLINERAASPRARARAYSSDVPPIAAETLRVVHVERQTLLQLTTNGARQKSPRHALLITTTLSSSGAKMAPLDPRSLQLGRAQT